MASTPGKLTTDRPPDTHPEAVAAPQPSASEIPTSQEQEEPLGAGPKRSCASSSVSKRTVDGLRPVYGDARIPGDESAHGGPVHLGTSKTMRTRPTKLDLRLALPGEVEAALAAKDDMVTPANQRPRRAPGLLAAAREELRARQRAGPQFPQTLTTNTRQKRSQSVGAQRATHEVTPPTLPRGAQEAQAREKRATTPSVWEATLEPISPPPGLEPHQAATNVRVAWAQLLAAHQEREDAADRAIAAQAAALAAPRQLGGEWADTLSLEELEAIDQRILDHFKKGEVIAAEKGRQEKFCRLQAITQAQAGAPGPAAHVEVDFAVLPEEIRFRQTYSNTAEVPQPGTPRMAIDAQGGALVPPEPIEVELEL
jgi:hypothetical protein